MDSAELKKKRTFRKFSFRGVELEQLVEMPTEKVLSAKTFVALKPNLWTSLLSCCTLVRVAASSEVLSAVPFL